jgi:hypothetical protein
MTLLFTLIVVCFLTNPPIAFAQSFADPTGDLFDRQGQPLSAEPYLDIVEVEVSQSGIEYYLRMKMNGPLPSTLDDPTILIEWDVLVDIDQNPGTRPWSLPLIDNGIGVDILVRLMLGASGQGYRAQIFDPATKKGLTIPFKVEGSSIELKYSSSVAPVPKTFDYVFAVRKSGNYGASGTEVAIDKAPNQGYFTFSDSKTILQTKPTAEHPKVLQHGMCKKFDVKNNVPINVTNDFTYADEAAWIFFLLDLTELPMGSKVTVNGRWYAPDGSWSSTFTWEPQGGGQRGGWALFH